MVTREEFKSKVTPAYYDLCMSFIGRMIPHLHKKGGAKEFYTFFLYLYEKNL